MQMLDASPDTSKPTDYPVALPVNIPEQREKLAGLFPQAKQKMRSAPNFLMNR